MSTTSVGSAELSTLSTDFNFLIPTRGRLVILEDAFAYRGKLIVPETAKRRPTTGRVIAVPTPEMAVGLPMNIPLEEALPERRWLGKRVLFGRYAGTLVPFQGMQDIRILTVEEILAEITDESKKLELREEMPLE